MTGTVAATPSCRPCKKTNERPTCTPKDSMQIQAFPTEGTLFENLDLSKLDLGDCIKGHAGKVRSYKMISVYPDDRGQFEQYGSGPNFQGGYLTLCTCAHQIRAEKKNPDAWQDCWLAGFTSPRLCDRTWLFYLAQVERAYPTAAELWYELPPSLQQAKSTRRNRLGDVYEPNPASPCADPFDAAHYHPPMIGHSHRESNSDEAWKNDIEFYNSKFKRHSAYIVAKPGLTFLWQTPTLYLKDHPRNQSWDSVDDLLRRLIAAT